MSKPRDLTKDDPAALLAEAMVRGPGGAIEAAEAAGQREMVASEVIPVEGPVEKLEALGFELGDVCEDDPLFRTVKLPEGWSRAGTDHSMHSDIIDERGRRRVGIFYKAAFYDRRADFHIEAIPTTEAQRDAAAAFEREVYGDDFLSWDRVQDLDGDDLVVTLSERAKDGDGRKILRPEADGGGYEKTGRVESRRFALDGSVA